MQGLSWASSAGGLVVLVVVTVIVVVVVVATTSNKGPSCVRCGFHQYGGPVINYSVTYGVQGFNSPDSEQNVSDCLALCNASPDCRGISYDSNNFGVDQSFRCSFIASDPVATGDEGVLYCQVLLKDGVTVTPAS
jgi:hypothetical protein